MRAWLEELAKHQTLTTVTCECGRHTTSVLDAVCELDYGFAKRSSARQGIARAVFVGRMLIVVAVWALLQRGWEWPLALLLLGSFIAFGSILLSKLTVERTYFLVSTIVLGGGVFVADLTGRSATPERMVVVACLAVAIVTAIHAGSLRGSLAAVALQSAALGLVLPHVPFHSLSVVGGWSMFRAAMVFLVGYLALWSICRGVSRTMPPISLEQIPRFPLIAVDRSAPLAPGPPSSTPRGALEPLLRAVEKAAGILVAEIWRLVFWVKAAFAATANVALKVVWGLMNFTIRMVKGVSQRFLAIGSEFLALIVRTVTMAGTGLLVSSRVVLAPVALSIGLGLAITPATSDLASYLLSDSEPYWGVLGVVLWLFCAVLLVLLMVWTYSRVSVEQVLRSVTMVLVVHGLSTLLVVVVASFGLWSMSAAGFLFGFSYTPGFFTWAPSLLMMSLISFLYITKGRRSRERSPDPSGEAGPLPADLHDPETPSRRMLPALVLTALLAGALHVPSGTIARVIRTLEEIRNLGTRLDQEGTGTAVLGRAAVSSAHLGGSSVELKASLELSPGPARDSSEVSLLETAVATGSRSVADGAIRHVEGRMATVRDTSETAAEAGPAPGYDDVWKIFEDRRYGEALDECRRAIEGARSAEDRARLIGLEQTIRAVMEALDDSS